MSLFNHLLAKYIVQIIGFFFRNFLREFEFKHAHVMGLIGVCLEAGSAPYIVMPYMANGSLWANGSLLPYLKRKRRSHVLDESSDED